MRILIVGALSWNPERVRSLHERGHQLWGLWARSMAWDQGPYPMLDDCVQTIPLERAAQTVADERIDCVYALFQVYDPTRWGEAAPAIEHDVWSLLRTLLMERSRGTFDAPIVFHFGFDVFRIDRDVVRALDGQIFCNREQLAYWTTPVADGGAGLDCVGSSGVVGFLDGDRPKLEFMTDDFREPLSTRTGELHTVCVGRPFNIDYVAMAHHEIHLHVYGNGVDDAATMIARDLVQRGSSRHVSSVREFVHLHPTRQTSGAPWAQVREWKSEWVREFSGYVAGWSYIASPLPFPPLADRSAIPNRLSTYVLAGLPVITDQRPGYYRYDELARLGINIDLDVCDYGALRKQLEAEAATGERRRRAVAEREAYSFDASIDALLGLLEQARAQYFAQPVAERRRPLAERGVGAVVGTGLIRRPSTPSSRLPQAMGATRRLARRIRSVVRQRVAHARTGRVARRLQSASALDSRAEAGPRIATLERFEDPSRRCDPTLVGGPGSTVVVWDLARYRSGPLPSLTDGGRALAAWLMIPLPLVGRWRVVRAVTRMRIGRRAVMAALIDVPGWIRQLRAREIDELVYFSGDGFELPLVLARETNTASREFLADATQYFGEFAFELLAVVPYAYWLHQQGRLRLTVSSRDTQCLYYFSPNHVERSLDRRFVPITEYPVGERGDTMFDRAEFPMVLDTTKWTPPPYGKVYADDFDWAKPPIVVCNKTSDEGWPPGPAVNTLGLDVLLEIVGLLAPRYTVIYNRPRAVDIVGDFADIHEPGDIEELKRAFPEVVTIQEIQARHPDLTFNELQLRVFSGCRHFVSVLGGASYLASYFGGTNVVYATRGWEVACGAYGNWFHEFSGARVIAAGTPKELIEAVRREFVQET